MFSFEVGAIKRFLADETHHNLSMNLLGEAIAIFFLLRRTSSILHNSLLVAPEQFNIKL